MDSLNIFGSCVSRDVLEYDTSSHFKLLVYIARQSFISSVSKPVRIDIESINLASRFQQRQVYSDLTKNAFALLGDERSDYLVIDFIDERFSLLKYNQSICTKSTYFLDSGCLKDYQDIKYQCKEASVSLVDGKPIEKYFDIFAKKILSIYPSDKIILHKAKMLNHYLDADGKILKFDKKQCDKNAAINTKTDYLYKLAENKFTNCFMIDYCYEYCADAGHKRGLAPMHYQEKYYERVLNDLLSFTQVGGREE